MLPNYCLAHKIPRVTERAANPAADGPLPLPHLERDLRLIQRYTFIHSDAPFTSGVPLVGPVIVLVKRAARRVLRAVSGGVLGSQSEFNAAVAEILFEFTRRASSDDPLTLNPAALNQALAMISKSDGEQARALSLLVRQVQLLEQQVRAAQLSAADGEHKIADLSRRLAELEKER